jgi:hypothetical protein
MKPAEGSRDAYADQVVPKGERAAAYFVAYRHLSGDKLRMARAWISSPMRRRHELAAFVQRLEPGDARPDTER